MIFTRPRQFVWSAAEFCRALLPNNCPTIAKGRIAGQNPLSSSKRTFLRWHVDGVGAIVERRQDGGSIRLTVEAPAELARFIAPKGSIAIDGVSMTVNEVSRNQFGVNVIPITQRETNLGALTMGMPVNLEIDMMARYVARLMAKDGA